jgi:hypothetical protein
MLRRMTTKRRSVTVKLLSKLAWAIALVAGYLTVASTLEACGEPAPKYGAIPTADGGTDAG